MIDETGTAHRGAVFNAGYQHDVNYKEHPSGRRYTTGGFLWFSLGVIIGSVFTLIGVCFL